MIFQCKTYKQADVSIKYYGSINNSCFYFPGFLGITAFGCCVDGATTGGLTAGCV